MPQHAMPQEISHSMENIKLNLSLISVIYGGKRVLQLPVHFIFKMFLTKWTNLQLTFSQS